MELWESCVKQKLGELEDFQKEKRKILSLGKKRFYDETKCDKIVCELPDGGGPPTSGKMMKSTCTMSRSARRPREDTLTSSPSSSSMAERGGRLFNSFMFLQLTESFFLSL